MQPMTPVVLLTLAFTVFPLLGGENENALIHEGVVEAPVDQVWAAYTTKEGLESWMVAAAEIDLRVGGLMKTRYHAKGPIEDGKGIENIILSYEPKRMISLKVTRAPTGFPFPNAITNMWTVVYFEPLDEKTTRVRSVSLGFKDDEESKKMREFFNHGNAVTLQGLQKRFSAKAPKKD